MSASSPLLPKLRGDAIQRDGPTTEVACPGLSACLPDAHAWHRRFYLIRRLSRRYRAQARAHEPDQRFGLATDVADDCATLRNAFDTIVAQVHQKSPQRPLVAPCQVRWIAVRKQL